EAAVGKQEKSIVTAGLSVSTLNYGVQAGVDGSDKLSTVQSLAFGQEKPIVDKVTWNIIKTAALVSLCFFLCQSWNQIYVTLMSFFSHPDMNSPFFHFTIAAVFSNCAINPLIYGTRYRQFRLGLKRLVSKVRRLCRE